MHGSPQSIHQVKTPSVSMSLQINPRVKSAATVKHFASKIEHSFGSTVWVSSCLCHWVDWTFLWVSSALCVHPFLRHRGDWTFHRVSFTVWLRSRLIIEHSSSFCLRFELVPAFTIVHSSSFTYSLSELPSFIEQSFGFYSWFELAPASVIEHCQSSQFEWEQVLPLSNPSASAIVVWACSCLHHWAFLRLLLAVWVWYRLIIEPPASFGPFMLWHVIEHTPAYIYIFIRILLVSLITTASFTITCLPTMAPTRRLCCRVHSCPCSLVRSSNVILRDCSNPWSNLHRHHQHHWSNKPQRNSASCKFSF